MLHLISTLVLLILGAGVYYRRKQEVHKILMVTAFALDVSLLLYIELTRSAVATVASGPKSIVWIHAAISLVVLGLYIVQLGLGRKLLINLAFAPASSVSQTSSATSQSLTSGATWNDDSTRKLHRNLGIAFLTFRVLNYATAFLL